MAPEREWHSEFDDDEIHEVMQEEAGRFAGCENIREASRNVPDGFQVEAEPTVLPEDMN